MIPLAEDQEDSEDGQNIIQRDLENEAESARLGCWSAFDFFVKHSLRDVKRRKCHFCLAFCSVFIAVLATVVINTVISQGPLIFLA